MAVDKSLISGSTTLLILSLLEEKDMYGYEMIDTLKGKSNNVFELKGNLISATAFYGRKGWLSVYEQEDRRKDEEVLPDYQRWEKAVSGKKERVERVFGGYFTGDRRCVFWNGVIIWN